MTKKLIYPILILLCVLSASCSKDDENLVAGEGDTLTLTINGKQTKLYVYDVDYDISNDEIDFILSDSMDDYEEGFYIHSEWASLKIGKDIGPDIHCRLDGDHKFSSGSVMVTNMDAKNRTVTLEFDGVWKSYDSMVVKIQGTVTIKYTETQE